MAGNSISVVLLPPSGRKMSLQASATLIVDHKEALMNNAAVIKEKPLIMR